MASEPAHTIEQPVEADDDLFLAQQPPHVHTQSMVTVRLSEPVSTAADALTGPPADDASHFLHCPGEMTPPRLPSATNRISTSSTVGVNLRSLEGESMEEESLITISDDEDAIQDPLEPDNLDPDRLSDPRTTSHMRSDSVSSVNSNVSVAVDWVALDKSEEEETKGEASDESIAFLLARLEQENNNLATDPRFGRSNGSGEATKPRPRAGTRPPSIHVLKKLVTDPSTVPSRYSLLPDPPPMTELEFWAALVKDYPQTAQRLPTLTTNKIRGGVPPPLRGVVWVSMCGARDQVLGEEFERLSGETSPYESLISKDIGRSFPGVEMFRDPDGDGQRALARVLKCFSLYDEKIGYCQGLGFLVGPLLMQMCAKDAFCVLVRLMDKYDLRSCFVPDLCGLHLRIYQFQQLLNRHLPELAAHLAVLQIEPAYLSKWFLSFFAMTCPLPMLFRIFDVIFAEGASETMMRVALSLMRRNEKKILASHEFEEVLQLLLGRSLWEPYNYNADDLVNDFMELTTVVTRETLQKLEASFKEVQERSANAATAIAPAVLNAASGFLGRLWASTSTAKPSSLNVVPSIARPESTMQRTPSKLSIASTLNSADVNSDSTNSISSATSAQTTETLATSRESSAADSTSIKSKCESMLVQTPAALSREDRDLHGQIEDLLTALTETQRDQALMATQLQREQEERSEDCRAFKALMDQLKITEVPLVAPSESDRRKTISGLREQGPTGMSAPIITACPGLSAPAKQAEDRLHMHKNLHRSSILETKHRLRESLIRSKDQVRIEASRARELTRLVEEREQEIKVAREELREARSRLQEGHNERQKLEKSIQQLRSCQTQHEQQHQLQQTALARLDPDGISERPALPRLETTDVVSNRSTRGGLRELRLGKTASVIISPVSGTSISPNMRPIRSSSLFAAQLSGATSDENSTPSEELLTELVKAKTSEAVARQELEELKAKFETLRKMFGAPSSSTTSGLTTGSSGVGLGSVSKGSAGGHRMNASESLLTPMSANPRPPLEPVATPSSTTSLVSGFWGWGRKSATPASIPENGN